MFSPSVNLRQASRLTGLARTDASISALEITTLLVFGALAAIAVSMLHLSFRIPGHAILRAVFPMAAGLAVVPRRSAGMVMAVGAMVTTALLRIAGVGEIQ